MEDLYKEISRADVANLVATVGNHITVMIEGHIGSGKSALLADLAERFKETHKAAYLDMTMLDIGDLQLPAVDHDSRTAVFYPNASLGLHEEVPMIIMFDEFGKASPSVKNAVLPMLIERRVGNRAFHPDTIVFATTNLGAENVGDLFKPHERNRMSFVRMAKPTANDWIAWGLEHGVPAEVLGWVNQNPQCFGSFDDYDDPNTNPYIFHPKSPRTAFVTHRSMEQAGRLVAQRELLGDDALTHALMGTIGQAAAMDMMSFVRLGDDLPTRAEILEHPATARIPDSPAALVLLCVQAVGWVQPETVDAWVTYMKRFTIREAAALWVHLAINARKIGFVAKNQQFTDWVVAEGYMFK